MTYALRILIIQLGLFGCGKSEPAVPEAALTTEGSDAESPRTGETSSPPGVEPGPDISPPNTGTPPVVVPAACAENTSKTLSKALVDSFQTSGSARTLKFELQLQDCNGAILPIRNQTLAFDIAVPLITQTWSYEIFDATGAKLLASAAFNKKSGEDIFGPRANYFLLETNALALPTPEAKLIFVVKIGSFTPRSSYPMLINTYQKVGNAAPATVGLNLAP